MQKVKALTLSLRQLSRRRKKPRPTSLNMRYVYLLFCEVLQQFPIIIPKAAEKGAGGRSP